MIYFLSDRRSKAIKIGYSDSFESALNRWDQLQTGNPNKLQLIAITTGDVEVEAALHTFFAHYHIRGEWFQDKAFRQTGSELKWLDFRRLVLRAVTEDKRGILFPQRFEFILDLR